MLRHTLVFSLLLLLAGCADLQRLGPQPAAPLVKAPGSPAEAIGIARDLAGRGRWSDAIALLDTASRRFVDDKSLTDERAAMQMRWEGEKRMLEDEIMVEDAENQQNKIALLERLSLAEPDNLVATSRRIYWREILVGKIEPLTACAERYAERAPALARRCFDVASGIPAGQDFEQRLARVNEQFRANEDVAAERRRARESKERNARVRVLLDNAKGAIEAHDYRRALDILAQVAELQPNNHEVLGLREEALSMINPQVEALVQLGDHLYLDEQLHAAVATWRAALSLKPDDQDIVARIERANNVLDRLDALRRQQKPPGAAE